MVAAMAAGSLGHLPRQTRRPSSSSTWTFVSSIDTASPTYCFMAAPFECRCLNSSKVYSTFGTAGSGQPDRLRDYAMSRPAIGVPNGRSGRRGWPPGRIEGRNVPHVLNLRYLPPADANSGQFHCKRRGAISKDISMRTLRHRRSATLRLDLPVIYVWTFMFIWL